MEETSKFTLCVIPTQFGKTFTAITNIMTELNQDNSFGKSLHIVFTMNTLLNNKQFSQRLVEVENKYGPGSICVFSSSYDGDYTHVKDQLQLSGKFIDEATCPKVIIMCSNKFRYDNGVKLIDILNRNKTSIDRVYTYYDELHKYITSDVRRQIETIHDCDIVWGITALTATPHKIWDQTSSSFWSKLKMIKLENFNDVNYAGYNDMNFVCEDEFFMANYYLPKEFYSSEQDKTIIGFIHYILKKYPSILEDNTRTFIPANNRCVSHNFVRDLIFHLNDTAVVIVLNGMEKTLKYKDENGTYITCDLKKGDGEVCETYSYILTQHKIRSRPLVITGFYCVSMGQTLTHRSLGSFTSAIFSHLDLQNDDIYQLFGRVTGRMKDWGDKYVKTNIYCPTNTMNRCIAMEKCARNMISSHNGEVVSQDDYTKPIFDMGEAGKSTLDKIIKPKPVKKNHTKCFEEFATQDEAISYAKKELNRSLRVRTNNSAPKDLLENGKNPSRKYLLNRWWGLSDNIPVRMTPTDNGKWFVYWDPNLLKKTTKCKEL